MAHVADVTSTESGFMNGRCWSSTGAGPCSTMTSSFASTLSPPARLALAALMEAAEDTDTLLLKPAARATPTPTGGAETR
jgi:hypothetical protein